MRRTLSSPLTVFWKFLFPALLVGVALYVILMPWPGRFTHLDGTPMSGGKLLLAFALGAVALAWPIYWSARLKRVQVDDRALYVSNYLTEIRIPLSEVTRVDESGSRRYFTLSIDLRKPSAFGQEIVFRPTLRFYWRGIHPVVRELEALCEQAGGGKKPGPGAGSAPLNP